MILFKIARENVQNTVTNKLLLFYGAFRSPNPTTYFLALPQKVWKKL